VISQVYARGRDALLAELCDLPKALAGAVPDRGDIVRTALQAVGVEALTIIRDAFLTRARGGPDASGIVWKPLEPETIAYGRRHGPTLTRQRRLARKAGRERRPLLTLTQDQLWRALYARAIAKGEKHGAAAARAWAIVKARGGKTILGEYGSTPVEILRDTGRLLNSLSPGAPDNRLEAAGGRVAIGTNVAYAQAHHEGNPSKGLPKRALWPDAWPDVWIERLVVMLKDAVAAILSARLK
jgi:hypothetical protein